MKKKFEIIFYLPIVLFVFISSCNQSNKKVSPNQTDQQTTAIISSDNDSFKSNVVGEVGKRVLCIFQDKRNNIWFGTNGEGAYRYDGKTIIRFTTENGLCENQINSIQEDKSGTIWSNTISGICRFNGKTFTSFTNSDAIKNGNSSHDEKLWFPASGGAYYLNGSTLNYLPLQAADAQHPNLTNSRKPESNNLTIYSVYCTLKERSGSILFGTQSMGVCRYDGKTFKWFTEKGLSGPAVRGLFEDRNGDLWFGNNGNGLFHYDGKQLTNFTEEKELSNPDFLKTGKDGPGTMARVWSINQDNNGDLWIGTYDAGVWRYDGKKLINYSTKDGLTSNAINTIYKDNNGELWIGTDGGGVCKFNGTGFSKFVPRSF